MRSPFARHLAVVSVFISILAIASCGGGGPGQAQQIQSEEVTIKAGSLQGFTQGDAQNFLGIPYAAPPVGPLRWQPPRAAAAWTGIKSARENPPSCPENVTYPVSEDCLYLNVYRPKTASTGPRPVAVYIHGSGFDGHAARLYDGSLLAVQTDAVVVIPNHRRGVFGYLALPSLSAEPGATPGAYGLLDMVAALQWVKDNAAAFGGDPNNVTLWGTSGGGLAICSLMGSPTLAKDLYQRRVLASPPCDLVAPPYYQPIAAAETNGTAYANALGCTDAATAATCLRSKSVAQLLATKPGVAGFGPAFGTSAMPASPMTALRNGTFDAMPTVLMSMHDEFRLAGWSAFGKADGAALYASFVSANTLGASAAAVTAEYPLTAYTDPGYAIGAIASDGTSIVAVCRFARIADILAAKSPLWYMEINDPDKNGPTLFGPAPAGMDPGTEHAADAFYLFGYNSAGTPTNDFAARGMSAQQEQMSVRTMKHLGSFMRGQAESSWAPYSTAANVLQVRPADDLNVSRASFRSDHHCDFWQPLLDSN
jgi:para-nitrobenzyl esterase